MRNPDFASLVIGWEAAGSQSNTPNSLPASGWRSISSTWSTAAWAARHDQMVDAVLSRAQSTIWLSVPQYGSSFRFFMRGSVPVMIKPSTWAPHSSETSRYRSAMSWRVVSARGIFGIENSNRRTMVFDAAARIRSVNCRSVASSAGSGMLLISPMVTQFEAWISLVEADREESRRTGIGCSPDLFCGEERRAGGVGP